MANPIIRPPSASAEQMNEIVQSLSPYEFDVSPANGSVHLIPETTALIINVLLWPTEALDDLQLILPARMVPGRRVFIYADKAIGQLTVTCAEPGSTVSNGIISMSANDLAVFNTVSTQQKLWARVATS